MDAVLAAYDEQINAINAKRVERIILLNDPARQAILAKYELIAQTIKELEEAGESVTGVGGYPLHIVGALYRIAPDLKIEEC